MIRPLTVLLLAAGSLCAHADASDQGIIIETYADFVAVDRVDTSSNLRMVVTGPAGYRQTLDHGADEIAYIETRSAEGVALADGLYTYEVWTEPKTLLTRATDDPRAGRDAGLKTKARITGGRTSGSFRVVNGVIVDPNLKEAPAQPVGGNQ